MRIITANVPCVGCTACCRGDLVFIHPEFGDRAEEYETFAITHPLTKQPGHALKHVGGNCVYLGEKGCTIHARRPAMCREFDCRRLYLSMDRAERRRNLRAGLFSKAVIDAAKERIDLLGEKEIERLRQGYSDPAGGRDGSSDGTGAGNGQDHEGDGRDDHPAQPADK